MIDNKIKTDYYSALSLDVDRLKDRILCYSMLYSYKAGDNFKQICEFAPELFGLFQSILSENIIIIFGKLLDGSKGVVSLKQYTRFADNTRQKEFMNRLNEIKREAKPIIDLRHERAAHKSIDLVLGKKESVDVEIREMEKVSEMIESFLYDLTCHVLSNYRQLENRDTRKTEFFMEKTLSKIKKYNSIEVAS